MEVMIKFDLIPWSSTETASSPSPTHIFFSQFLRDEWTSVVLSGFSHAIRRVSSSELGSQFLANARDDLHTVCASRHALRNWLLSRQMAIPVEYRPQHQADLISYLTTNVSQ
jgi:hypothetical protein